MGWYRTGPHWCPKCQPVFNKKGRRIDSPLKRVEADYSGCEVDLVECPNCGTGFEVSYRVDQITELKPKGDSDAAQG